MFFDMVARLTFSRILERGNQPPVVPNAAGQDNFLRNLLNRHLNTSLMWAMIPENPA